MGTRNRKEKEMEVWSEEKAKKISENTFEWEDADGNELSDTGTSGKSTGRHRRKENRLTGSIAAKIIAFFLLALSVFTGLGAGGICAYMAINEFYTSDLDHAMMQMMNQECGRLVYNAERYIRQGNMKAVSVMLSEYNLDLELLELGEEDNLDLDLLELDGVKTATVLWSSKLEYETNLKKSYFIPFEMGENPVKINGHTLKDGEMYLYRVYIDPSFPKEDIFRKQAERTEFLYGIRYWVIGVCAGGIFLCILCFLFLMCSAGHRNGWQWIVPGALTSIHLDVLTFLFGGAAFVFCIFLLETVRFADSVMVIATLTAGGTVLVVWLTFYFMDLAIRVKLGKGLRYSLIYVVLRGCWRAFCFLCRELAALVRGIPLVLTTAIAYMGICILEFLWVILFVRDTWGFLLWMAEKAVLLAVVLYIAMTCKKLLKASRALAEGQENYRVDTYRMLGEFKEHGENLNSLGQGISRAVAERTKSERMKTELISNVSHDLKTPLTSIINYADLIWEEVNSGQASVGKKDGQPGQVPSEAGGTGKSTVFGEAVGELPQYREKVCGGESDKLQEGEMGDSEMLQPPAYFVNTGKVREYAEVLLRQSRRLKKLLEDLLEASKATTGNLEVNLEPCEVGVLLSQAVGEYQQRMEQKKLELIARQPEEPVTILADGRRLWRVFENLLNNICKYAQENSRVYINVLVKEAYVQIIFRNMSKYPLDISADELEERFVRGDKSRHMEGNGLGLSIAKSLVELQKGQMEITIDGDLFKVVLVFPLYFQ